MAKEFERNGIPTAFISTIVPLAESIGPNRIIPGRAITHPLGDPALPRHEERAFRRRLVERALAALQTDVHGPTVFR
jgi:glycine reductase